MSFVEKTFNYKGAVQTWPVPDGVTSVSVDAYGASSSLICDRYLVNGKDGVGFGGRVECNLSVTPSQTLNIFVGGSSESCGQSGWPSRYVGWNGGAGGYRKGGGGATDIRIGGTSLVDRVIVSGGGGSGSWYARGGDGGGLVGQDGHLEEGGPGITIGHGGTQSAGGLGGHWHGGSGETLRGSLGYGKVGQSVSGNGGNGHGGGGYYGGGGGAYKAGGGGGSSYTHLTLASSVVHTQGVQRGHGKLILSYDIPSTRVYTITGTVEKDETLSVDDVAGVTYQWQKSVDDGNNWTDIDGATGNTHTLSEHPKGTMLRVKIVSVVSPTETITTLVQAAQTFRSTAIGDPYIYPMRSSIPVKLPDAEACYRLYQSKDTFINAEVSIATEEHEQRMSKFVEKLGHNIEHLVVDGYFFSKFYIVDGENKLLIDLREKSFSLLEGSDKTFFHNSMNEKQAGNKDWNGKAKNVVVEWVTEEGNQMKATVSFFENPHIENGISLSVTNLPKKALGLCVSNYRPKLMRIPYLTTEKYAKIEKKVNKSKNPFQKIAIKAKNEKWLWLSKN